jgi:hypothetical protein
LENNMTRRITALTILLTGCLLAGCGGMPKPKITPVKSKAGTANVRVALVGTNYDSSWDKEGVTLYITQQWRNRDDVPIGEEIVAEKHFNAGQGSNRGVIALRDAEKKETNTVVLKFELKSGPDPLNQNVSAAITREWKISSSWAEADMVLTCAISRTGNNNYTLDVVYAQNMATGDIEQVLPNE